MVSRWPAPFLALKLAISCVALYHGAPILALRLKGQSKPSVSLSHQLLTFPLFFSLLSFCFFFAGRPPFPFFLLSPLFELYFIPTLFPFTS
jgi:hypothetical protein